jgi:thiamine-phosphate pyrophosphorylase
MRLVLPRLYVILDSSLLKNPPERASNEFAEAGVQLMQYREKSRPARDFLRISQQIIKCAGKYEASVIVNDRPDIAMLAGAAGVHVGQDDLRPEQARAIVGNQKLVGVSTHTLEQFQGAAETSADYIAVGPIFGTKSKSNPDPVVGLEFIKRVRPLTTKPIVAIGGITLDTAQSVIAAGADCVAVISDIVCAASPPDRARQYLEALGAANAAAV